MDFWYIAQEYFIAPLWERTGYNIVNTSVYAIIALAAIYFIYRQFQKQKFEIGKSFWIGALCWVVFGSSLRVITDSVDSGAMEAVGGPLQQAIVQSNIFHYGLFTVSPGIYIVTAILFLLAVFIERKIGIKYWAAMAGAVLALFNLLVLVPLMQYAEYALWVLFVASAAAGLAAYFLRLNKIELWCPVFAHALDGAATWTAIDIFGPAHGVAYFEQHVFSRFIGEISPLGFGLFFLVKAAFAIAAVKVIDGEKDARLRMLALLVIAIIGLAPGLRDILRMAAGT